ncbi:MAG TPA: ABC transporter substrate-binding protein [Candidatus Acidoferrales bacterium]|nr:ABC transporter substrate-binding protein [Candidatus Acidoferrales bacterium]
MRAIIALLIFSLSVPAWGQDPLRTDNPAQFIQTLMDRVLDQIKTERPRLQNDRQALRQLVNEGIVPHADFRTTSRLVLGPFWDQASDAQKAAFIEAFQDMLMRTYADALLSYEDQPIRVKRPASGYFDWDKSVPTEIIMKDGRPVQVKYYLYRNPQGEWKVYDVVAENVSFIMSYRNVLQDDARRLGLDGLIQKMRSQTIPVAQTNAQKS